jgi:hypothetical protein
MKIAASDAIALRAVLQHDLELAGKLLVRLEQRARANQTGYGGGSAATVDVIR